MNGKNIFSLINLSRQSLIWMVFHALHSRLLGVSVQTFMCFCTCWAVQSAVHSFCGWCDSHPLLTLTIKSEVLTPWTVRNLLVLISTMAILQRWNYSIAQGAHQQTNHHKTVKTYIESTRNSSQILMLSYRWWTCEKDFGIRPENCKKKNCVEIKFKKGILAQDLGVFKTFILHLYLIYM